jgi:hypothetical protein
MIARPWKPPPFAPGVVKGVRRALVISAAAVALTGCGTSSTPPAAAHTSPSTDAATQKYVALAHEYWTEYKTAQRDQKTFVKVCWGLIGISITAPNDPNLVEPQTCKEISSALAVADEAFLSELNSTPPPARFAADDQVFRTQIPKAISAAQAMVSAASAGKRQAVIDAMTSYIDAMYPPVTDALDDVDPFTPHE